MQGILQLDYLTLEMMATRDKLSLAQIKIIIDERRQAVAAASGQFATYSSTMISDIYGRLTFHVSVENGAVQLWAFTGSSSFMTLDRVPTGQEINEWSQRLWTGEYWCDHCKRWVSNQLIRSYSFAGRICEKCYDPEKHLPPDTSGD